MTDPIEITKNLVKNSQLISTVNIFQRSFSQCDQHCAGTLSLGRTLGSTPQEMTCVERGSPSCKFADGERFDRGEGECKAENVNP